MKQTLIDTLSFAPVQPIVESIENGKKEYYVEGIVQRCDKENQNKRIYPRSVLEKAINSASVQEAMLNNGLIGVLDHPEKGSTLLKEAALAITKLHIQENGDVIGRLKLLSTPNGMILRALVEDGVRFGVSSRGTGSLKEGKNGFKIVDNDFNLDSIDAVFNPSTQGAYPKYVTESINTNEIKEKFNMEASDKFAALEAKASNVLRIKSKGLDTETRSLVETTITSLMVDASKIGAEAPEIGKLAENLINDLSKKRSEIRLSEDDGVATHGNADGGIFRDQINMRTGETDERGEGGWETLVNPNALAVPSGVEQMITSLVAEAVDDESDEEPDSDSDDKKKKKKKKGEEEEGDESMEESFKAFATSVLKNKKLPKAARGLAAAYITEATRRKNEVSAFKKIVSKMQEKFDVAIKEGKVVVESTDENLAFKYKLSTDVLKEVVRRYHVNEAYHYAKERLVETGLDKNNKAVAIVAEALKDAGTKRAIEETIVGFAKISGIDLSKEVRPSSLPVPVTESTEKAPVPSAKATELPLKIEGKIAKLTEATQKQASAAAYGVDLGNRLAQALTGSRSK